MNVPPFPAPPSALDDEFPVAFKHITKIIKVPSPDDCPSGKYNRSTLNSNFTTKKRARHFLRLGNSVHPQKIDTNELPKQVNRLCVTELFTLKMTEQQLVDEDDADVICAADIRVSTVSPISTEFIQSKAISVETYHQPNNKRRLNNIPSTIQHPINNKSTSVQTHQYERMYMLKILPTLNDVIVEDSNIDDAKITVKICRHFRFIGRICFCQFGLAWLLAFWTVAGAAAFYVTESPRERAQVFQLKDMQRDLAVSLAMELRQLKASDEEIEPLWSNKVQYYVLKHEKLLLTAVNAGYGESGDTAGGQLWTFSGCLLFTISLITTLGFGAPVPHTTQGRAAAVIFAAFGIPTHFLLIVNLGLLLAMRLQRFAIRKKYGANFNIDEPHNAPIPKWVQVVPFVWIVSYYTLGIIGFGAGRSRPLAASLLFPLDFTAAGGLATVSGIGRIIYGLYLEGAVTIAAMTVAVLRVSATESLTNIGLKYGLLTEI